MGTEVRLFLCFLTVRARRTDVETAIDEQAAIDSAAGLWSAGLAVTFTRTWMFSIASAYRGHARPRVPR